MVFESIAAVTAGLSAINSLFNQAKEAQGNFQGIMNGLTGFQDGLQKYEIEKRASLVKPLTPQEAMKVAMAKQQIDRYNKELHNMCIMSREGQQLWDNYQQALHDSKERHKAQKDYYKNKSSEVNQSIAGDLDALGRNNGQRIYQDRTSNSSRGRDLSVMED